MYVLLLKLHCCIVVAAMSSVCPVVVSYRRPVLVGGISHPLEAESGDCTPLLELGLLTTELKHIKI